MTTLADPESPSEDASADPATNGTSIPAIIACNSISILACIITLVIYVTLSFKLKYKRLMRRTSLVLATCMAFSDLVLHCSNLAGYGSLPPGFVCAFVGGWLFATPTILSIFYSCCIALNSQLAFVFKRPAPRRALGYFVLVPIVLSFLITFSALGTGIYGFDDIWGYCWYATRGLSTSTVLMRITFTYSLPTLICIVYLLVATITISLAVFGKSPNPIPDTLGYSSSRTTPSGDTQSHLHTFPPSSPPTSPPIFPGSFVRHSLTSLAEGLSQDRKLSKPSLPVVAETSSPALPKLRSSSEVQSRMKVLADEPPRGQSRKKLVMRQLTIRLIGYIMTPILCLLPGIIADLITKAVPKIQVPTTLNAFFDALNGLIGLFNALLMLSDPALLAVWKDLRVRVTYCADGTENPGLMAKLRCPFRSKKKDPPSSTAGGGAAHGAGRHKRNVTNDVVASGFGLGARTRVDVSEEEEIMVEEEPGPTLEVSRIDSRNAGREQEKGPRRHLPDLEMQGRPSHDDAEQEILQGDTQRGGDTRTGHGLEVHVRVDVTRSVRRIQLMEDWLSGL